MSYRKTKFVKVLQPIKKGAYFLFTIPYGLFYLGGAFAGYAESKSVVCLGGSGAIGVVFILLGIGHMVDYMRTNVAIEAFYILVPLFTSMVVMILMACFYGIGAKYMPSGFVATVAGIGMVFYIYFFIREFGKQLLETGDARFSRGEYIYKRVKIDENTARHRRHRDRDTDVEDDTLHLRNASL